MFLYCYYFRKTAIYLSKDIHNKEKKKTFTLTHTVTLSKILHIFGQIRCLSGIIFLLQKISIIIFCCVRMLVKSLATLACLKMFFFTPPFLRDFCPLQTRLIVSNFVLKMKLYHLLSCMTGYTKKSAIIFTIVPLHKTSLFSMAAFKNLFLSLILNNLLQCTLVQFYSCFLHVGFNELLVSMGLQFSSRLKILSHDFLDFYSFLFIFLPLFWGPSYL